MNNVKKQANELKEGLTKIRRTIHQNPELGFNEYETTRLVKEELNRAGIKVVPLGTKTGVLGILNGEKDGSNTVTALRADMDALPIIENTRLSYASKNTGVMHACGHDGHVAMLLGAAKLLSTMKDMFSGTVKFIFQPAEEIGTGGGAKSMVEAGVLEDPPVDTIVALHGFPDVEVGKIGVFSGQYLASADKFTVKMKGPGGHGARPQLTVDTVLAASTAVVQLQNIVSRQIDALEQVVLSVCTLHGGKVFNVIPSEVEFSGTVRCLNNEVRNGIEDKINKILSGVSQSFGCEYELTYEYGVPATVNNPEVINAITEAATQVLGEGHVEQLDKPCMGAEDFSLYLEKVPKGAFIRLGIAEPGKDRLIFHTDKFNFNDDAIPVGVSVLVQYVLNQNK